MTTFNITLKEGGDYIEEMPIGLCERDSIQQLIDETGGEIIGRGLGWYVIECEWGNGEGFSIYHVEVKDFDLTSTAKSNRDQTISMRLASNELELFDTLRGEQSRSDFLVSLLNIFNGRTILTVLLTIMPVMATMMAVSL